MSPPNLNFWSTSRKESLESHRKMHLEIGFCEHYCVQMTIGKRYIERERPFATEFESIMNSCFNQYNVSLVKNVNVAQVVNALSKKFFVFSHF